MDFTGILVGLGNPGDKYSGTRHNCGFMLVEALLDAVRDQGGDVSEISGSKFSCRLWRVRSTALGGQWLAAMPETFMNLSGQCVQPLLAWHKVPPAQLIVAHDELDIPPGDLRFKFGGGNAGHNGLKSITQLLGTPDFYRLRIGIGRPPVRGDVSNWVLGRPSGDDQIAIQAAIQRGITVLTAFVDKGTEAAVRACRPPKAKTDTNRADKA